MTIINTPISYIEKYVDISEKILCEIRDPIYFFNRDLYKKIHGGGVYLIEAKDGSIIYVGETKKFSNRTLKHAKGKSEQKKMFEYGYKVRFHRVKDELDRKLLERYFIKLYDPVFNKEGKNRYNNWVGRYSNHYSNWSQIEKDARQAGRDLFSHIAFRLTFLGSKTPPSKKQYEEWKKDSEFEAYNYVIEHFTLAEYVVDYAQEKEMDYYELKERISQLLGKAERDDKKSQLDFFYHNQDEE